MGVYKDDTLVLTTELELASYIDECIKNKIIVVDTETNNSLDPLTCKLMGLCLYTPGQKNIYVPVNHTDLNDNKLTNQVTEEQIRIQLQRAMECKECKFIFHNAKFDYKVIYCTCGIKLRIDWDTLVGARLLDENEPAKLKWQYITKLDPSIEKYSIDHLFTVPYQYVDPAVFALYAATDSFMTYKLYLYQLSEFNKPDNLNIFKLAKNVEIPVLEAVADMELNGVAIDTDYANRLSIKYHKKLDIIQNQINEELNRLKSEIDKWRNSAAANLKPKKAVVTKTIKKVKYSLNTTTNTWVEVNTNRILLPEEVMALKLDTVETGGKSKAEQLSDPIETTSPTQLAILFYDIMKVPVIDRENPRGTGTDILQGLAKDYPLAKILLEQRTVLKLLDGFIDTLPTMTSPKDGRIHSNFNSLGTTTGRFSCTEPNLQQIPSKNLEVRMIFKAAEKGEQIEFEDSFTVKDYQEIETPNGWILSKQLKINNIILVDSKPAMIKDIKTNENNITIFI